MKELSTASLSEELSKRIGVQSLNVDPYEEITIESKSGKQTIVGPAIILINQD